MKNQQPKKQVEAWADQAGFALVIVLGSVTLLSIALAVLLSLTSSERVAAKSSGDVRRVNVLAETAFDTLVHDLRQEMHDGSMNHEKHRENEIIRYIPTSGTTGQPQRTILEAPADPVVPTGFLAHYLKDSRRNVPFHSGIAYSGSGAMRASAASTATASLNGRLIRKERWNAHALFGGQLPANFQSPDWVYVTRGEVGAPGAAVATLKDASVDNKNFVVGRFAYTIHDVGARLDINVAGNLLSPELKAKKGLLHQAELGEIPGIDPELFLKWRSQWSATRGGDKDNELFDPKRDFVKVLPGDQTFLSRGDLINYATRNPTIIPAKALPYLTTFSRELNLPSHRPRNPSGPHYNTSYDYEKYADTPPAFSASSTVHPKGYNLDLANARNAEGNPAIKRRFPLSRLSWITKDGPLEGRRDDVLRHFGLRWKGAPDFAWDYVGADQTVSYDTLLRVNHIKRLDQIPDSREPDFFELLMAGILEGSIGVHTTATMGVANLVKQKNPCLQAIHIGACIIDQANEGYIPTRIRIDNGEETPNRTYSFFGIKNLPYLHGFTVINYRPSVEAGNNSTRDFMYCWLIPEMWNPHANPATLSGWKFRIRILSGENNVYVTNLLPNGKQISDANGKPTSLKSYNPGGVQIGSEDRWIEWDGNTDFSNVTLLDPSNARYHPKESDSTCLQYSDLTDGSARVFGFCIARGSAPDWNFTGDEWDGATRDIKPFYISPGTGLEVDLQVNDGNGWRTYWRLEPTDKWRDNGRVLSRNLGGSGPEGNEAPFFVRPVVHSRVIAIDPYYNRFGWVTAKKISSSTYDDWLKPIPFRPNALTSGSLAPGLATVDYGPANNAYGSTPSGNKDEDYTPVTSYLGRLPQNIPTPDSSFSLPGTKPQLWFYMTDEDGIVRFGDGILGVQNAAGNPMMHQENIDYGVRPFMLNRPFRSVGELGYAYRGLPWKTLDFFTPRSADLALLDIFCMTESEADKPVVAGKVSANTRIDEVLKAVIVGAGRTENGGTIPSSQLNTIVRMINGSNALAEGPYRNKADVIARVAQQTLSSNNPSFPIYKVQREALARALAESTQTRTWNLLIDMVAQVGRFPGSATSLDQFQVNAEQHYWIHLAIDRYTGEVVDQQWEVVTE